MSKNVNSKVEEVRENDEMDVVAEAEAIECERGAAEEKSKFKKVWDKFKKPVAIGAGILGGVVILCKLMSNSNSDSDDDVVYEEDFTEETDDNEAE